MEHTTFINVPESSHIVARPAPFGECLYLEDVFPGRLDVKDINNVTNKYPARLLNASQTRGTI